MAYDPTEPTVKDFVRGRVGDTLDPALLEGDDARYLAIVARHAALTTPIVVDGHLLTAGTAYAVADAAAALAAQIRRDPRSLGSAGDSLTMFDPTDLDALARRYADAADVAVVTEAGGGPRAGLIVAGRTHQLR